MTRAPGAGDPLAPGARSRRLALLPKLAAGALLGAMAGILLVGMLAASGTQLALLDAGPRCLFRTITGVDCPFCGMTRATLALGRGELAGALELHPLAPLVLAGTAALCIAVLGDRLAWLRRRGAPALLLGAVTLVWLIRLLA